MTNAFFLVGSYIMAGPMCLCLTNRLCVLKQPRMAWVMTNCINKTFITLNILATKSQLLHSTNEHPVPLPHSYSSHTMSPMHKLAFFCHTGGLAGWELAHFVLLMMRQGAVMLDDCKTSLLTNQQKSLSFSLSLHLSIWMCLCLGLTRTFLCVHFYSLYCTRTLLLHCVLPTVIRSRLISHLPLKQQPLSWAEQ